MKDRVLSAEWTGFTASDGYLNVGTTFILGIVLIIVLLVKNARRPHRFPPGPPGLPIIGNVFDLTATSEVLFDKWSKVYGDVFSFRVGDRWVVVLNHQEVIKEAMLKYDVEFSGRPQFYSAEIASDGFKDIVFSNYSDTWKLHRKLAHSAFRKFATGHKLDELVHGVIPQVQQMLKENIGKPFDPKLMITLTLYNVFSKMCFSESYDFSDPRMLGYITMSQELAEKVGFGLVADYFPWARFLSYNGASYIQRMKQKYMEWTSPQLQRHRETLDPNEARDFCDLMLLAQMEAMDSEEDRKISQNLSDIHLKQTVNDIFLAGIETSMQRLYWAIALMTEYPDVQAKIQGEIEVEIGRGRHPVIKDRGNLPYTEATLYEMIRYSTVGPVGVPHATMVDTKFRGYLIPKGTTVLLNQYSMHFDEREWTDPHSFRPEHFLDESGTTRLHPSSFQPFGTGRRSCLGEAVAKADLFLIFTWLLQNYTFRKVPEYSEENLLKLLPETAAGRVLQNYKILIEER
ncbi:steroid 17-alpha-hydroxylase/17,20 lyase-like isoform X1 [Strongylocentrotus purpuratus]|uniref:Steroid 21-hydroxylase n=2 Tax=Strongylocentrotus purpuratus TaxID=7668 RepID=A0A7M7NE66_STRPU|nr:steroid 17-alpha-hydroxylase/17,20 lyase-like isoform X1 [Strongylocentrotus purpuratus]